MRSHEVVAALLLVACAAFVGCATGATLRAESEALGSELAAAQEAGADRCVPKELAVAEAHLEFMQAELDRGNAVRAASHRDKVMDVLPTVVAGAKACKPKALPDPDRDSDRDGVPDENDACPDTPGPVEQLGCPDRDGDRITDPNDLCPDVREDFDGEQDEDGCPEDGDRDGDGILDSIDECPLQPETMNGFEDDDGCPDFKLELVEVRRDIGKIEIKQTVHFDTAAATIKPVSFRLLNEVAQAIKSSPTMNVLVEGHTDSVGTDSLNLKLSDARATSVREYLIAQGIESARLTAIGFGEAKPIDNNRTKAGRERNRRVEFTITKE